MPDTPNAYAFQRGPKKIVSIEPRQAPAAIEVGFQYFNKALLGQKKHPNPVKRAEVYSLTSSGYTVTDSTCLRRSYATNTRRNAYLGLFLSRNFIAWNRSL